VSDTTPLILDAPGPHAAGRTRSWAGWAQVAVLGGLVCLVYWPVLSGMVYKWRTDGNWSHGFLVPVFSLYFLMVHRRTWMTCRRRADYLGLVLILASLGLLYGSMAYGGFGYPQALSLIPCLWGLVWFLGGRDLLKAVWFPIAFLICAIPLPQSYYFQLTLPLRRLASHSAAALLGLLPGVETEVRGVVIEYDYLGRAAALNVEEACSGMRLMMSFVTLGIAMAYLGDRPLWQRLIMIVSCAPIAVFCNMIRVFVTGVLYVYGHEDWAQGTIHGLLGLAMLPIALGLFAAVGYVLSNLFVETSEPEASGSA